MNPKILYIYQKHSLSKFKVVRQLSLLITGCYQQLTVSVKMSSTAGYPISQNMGTQNWIYGSFISPPIIMYEKSILISYLKFIFNSKTQPGIFHSFIFLDVGCQTKGFTLKLYARMDKTDGKRRRRC